MLGACARIVGDGGWILCFHSLTTPELPAEGDAHIPAETFTALLDVARGVGEIVPLGELLDRHVRGRSTSGLVAVTFDDAYAALLPILSTLLPRTAVTVFVVTGEAERGGTFWWDRIDGVYPRVSPERWRAFEQACGLPEEYRRGQPSEYGPLRPFRQWLLATYAGRWPVHLEQELAALESEAGVRTAHRAMTYDELDELAAMPAVALGVHTVSHPVLPLLSDEDCLREIGDSHDRLRERFTNVLPVLAVPFGLYDERTLRAASAAGMRASLTLASRRVSPAAGRGLPRFCITRHDSRARLMLRLLGVADLARNWSVEPDSAPYPELPSPTT